MKFGRLKGTKVKAGAPDHRGLSFNFALPELSWAIIQGGSIKKAVSGDTALG